MFVNWKYPENYWCGSIRFTSLCSANDLKIKKLYLAKKKYSFKKLFSMTDFIPLFPLKLVVFPREQLNLHIFEPRYKQLIRECNDNGTTFGIPAFIENKVMPFGTEIQLLKIEKIHENGEMDIRTRGKGVFRIDDYYKEVNNKLYSGADITRIKNENNGDLFLAEQILELAKELFQVLGIKKKLPTTPAAFKTFNWGHLVGYNFEQEYEMLCLTAEKDRQTFMLKHLTRLIPVVREMDVLKKRAQLNGHFKNVIPPKT